MTRWRLQKGRSRPFPLLSGGQTHSDPAFEKAPPTKPGLAQQGSNKSLASKAKEPILSEAELAALCLALGASKVAGWSPEEEALSSGLPRANPTSRSAAHQQIQQGEDPLGEAFCRLRSPEQRRPAGATYTPTPLVESMLAWSSREGVPSRVVDPGSGSGRFLVAAGRRFPQAELLGVELDPLAALMTRGHLAAARMEGRARVLVCDYRALSLPSARGKTLFFGNPPYVRHHLLTPEWKSWLRRCAWDDFGLEASQLAGLHVHFFLATAKHARAGDLGVLITAAEWLDVKYGRLVRELLLGYLGLRSLHVIEPVARPFPDAAATAVISCFEIGARPRTVGLRRVGAREDLGALEAGRQVPRDQLQAAPRWTPLTRPPRSGPAGFIELGELCRVHRGQVTGANRVWLAGPHSAGLPDSVLLPSVTKARELFEAGSALTDAKNLRRVIDIPVEIDSLSVSDRKRVERFLQIAKSMGADRGYVACHRRAWWSVGLRAPAPILSTYMARRPPVFVRNAAEARHINVAHGLYPRGFLSESYLDLLAAYLSRSTSLEQGRTYAGGLTKFEPGEVERLLVPGPEMFKSIPDL